MPSPVPPDFLQPFLLNERVFLQKTAEKGKDKRGQARMGRSKLSKYSNYISFSIATSFFHVFTPFFFYIWPI